MSRLLTTAIRNRCRTMLYIMKIPSGCRDKAHERCDLGRWVADALVYATRDDADARTNAWTLTLSFVLCLYLSFFLSQYVGYSRIGSPSLSLKRASEVVRSIIRRGPRRNKERVALIITPQEMFVRDTISRVSFVLCIINSVKFL